MGNTGQMFTVLPLLHIDFILEWFGEN